MVELKCRIYWSEAPPAPWRREEESIREDVEASEAAAWTAGRERIKEMHHIRDKDENHAKAAVTDLLAQLDAEEEAAAVAAQKKNKSRRGKKKELEQEIAVMPPWLNARIETIGKTICRDSC